MAFVVQGAPALTKTTNDFHNGPDNQDVWNKLFNGVFEKNVIYEFHVYKVNNYVTYWIKFKYSLLLIMSYV